MTNIGINDFNSKKQSEYPNQISFWLKDNWIQSLYIYRQVSL